MRACPALLLATLLGCPSADEPASADLDELAPVALPEAVAATFAEEVEDYGATSATIAVLYGDVLYADAVGPRSPGGSDPVEPSTLYRMGSITKMMTATAVLQAVEAGSLDLADHLVDLAPSVSVGGVYDEGLITLHHLLSHSSGLSETTPIMGGAQDERLQDYLEQDFNGNHYAMAPAGALWNYSNPNFSLAGALLERADGRWYREVVEDDVWGPLGMERSCFLGDEVLADGDFASSVGWDWSDNEGQRPVEPDSYDDAWSRPSGFAWTSVLELIRFGQFLLAGDEAVLGAEGHGLLVGEQVPMHTFRGFDHYGYGTMVWRQYGTGGRWYELDVLTHNGAVPGHSAELLTVPSRGLVVATLAAGDGAYFGRTLGTVFEEILGEAAVDLPDRGIDDDDPERYVGTYEDPMNVGTVEVFRQGTGLRWSMPRLDSLGIPYGAALTPLTRGTFRATLQGQGVVVALLAEDGGEDGPTRWLRHRAFVADRGAPARSVDDSALPDAETLRRRLTTQPMGGPSWP